MRSFVLAAAMWALTLAPGSARDSQREATPIRAVPVRQLHSREALFPNGPLFYSAASGLVKRGARFYVVADDGQALGWFEGTSPITNLNLLDRPPLPTDSHLRGSIKPDFEALTWLETPSGPGLLALCSGSGELRNAAVFVKVGGEGKLGEPLEIDFKPLYDRLRERFSELNIEGVAVLGDRVRLLQRGNSSKDPNAVIDLNLPEVLEAVQSGGAVPASALLRILPMDLGTIRGSNGPVRWTFTDLCPLSRGYSVFTAAAEDTENPYEDGEILGSALGLLDSEGHVRALGRIKQKIKLEGLAVDGEAFYAVTDADDPDSPATLYKIKMPPEFRRRASWFRD